jgi:hypothetical protein
VWFVFVEMMNLSHEADLELTRLARTARFPTEPSVEISPSVGDFWGP